MTMAIEINGKRIECDNEKDAKKIIRREKALANKEALERAENNRIASEYASKAAWDLLRPCAHIADSAKHRWEICTADGRYAHSESDYVQRRYCEAIKRSGKAVSVTMDTPSGKAVLELWGVTVTMMLQNGSGWDMAVKVVDDDTAEAYWICPGFWNGVTERAVVEGDLAKLVDSLVDAMIEYRKEQAAK